MQATATASQIDLPLPKKTTAKIEIVKRLERTARTWLAIHEFNIPDYSQNCIGTRLPEMALAGQVVSRFRAGKNYKEWGLPSWEVPS